MVGFPRKLADYLAATIVLLGGPLFRAVGRWPAGFPRYLRQADRSGVHFRATHYYQPTYRDADLPEDVTGERDLPGIELHEHDQIALLSSLDVQAELLSFPDSDQGELRFYFGNGAYDAGDAEALYALLRTRKPKRLIEVGSGHSTRIAKAALAANRAEDSEYACRHVCIEPYEMDWLERLDVEVVRKRVEQTDLALFGELEAGDVLFIDSSHVIRPFGDVLFLYQQVIPRLKPGVLVHVHDVFTPRDYPERWLRQERRLWNEQYLLETLLAHSPRYRVVLALNWMRHRHPEAFYRAFPVGENLETHEPGALWFEVV